MNDSIFLSLSYSTIYNIYNENRQQIGQMFPNSQVMLNLRSSTMPNMAAFNATTKVDADGEIKFYATKGKGKVDYFLTLSAVRFN